MIINNLDCLDRTKAGYLAPNEEDDDHPPDPEQPLGTNPRKLSNSASNLPNNYHQSFLMPHGRNSKGVKHRIRFRSDMVSGLVGTQYELLRITTFVLLVYVLAGGLVFRQLEHTAEHQRCKYITQELNNTFPKIQNQIYRKVRDRVGLQFNDFYRLAHIFAEIQLHKATLSRIYNGTTVVLDGTNDSLRLLEEIEMQEKEANYRSFKKAQLEKIGREMERANLEAKRLAKNDEQPTSDVPSMKELGIKDVLMTKQRVYKINNKTYTNLFVSPLEEENLVPKKDVSKTSPKLIDDKFSEEQTKTYTFIYEPVSLKTNRPDHKPHVFTVTCKEIWGYWDSVYFAGTVITTIGYGQIAPSTAGGRIFCMIYMIIGIAIFMIFAISLSKILRTNMRRLRKRYFNNTLLARVNYQLLFVSSFILLFIILPAWFFWVMEEDWNFLEAFYYVVVTVTTVGFGDYWAF